MTASAGAADPGASGGPSSAPRVVIVGGGFAGLYAAKALANQPVAVTLIDKRNFHLFQPLLYQVATGGLSPGDIAAPLRAVLARARNIQVLDAEVTELDVTERVVVAGDRRLGYDTLILATGVSHHYFGHDDWAAAAPGLKTLEDALAIRQRIFAAFERAEWAEDPAERRAWLTFVVVGGGPTGVELAGALGELTHETLRGDFRRIDTRDARILLLEGLDRILPTFPEPLSAAAAASLARLGVTALTRTTVVGVTAERVMVRNDAGDEAIPTRTVLWAAGVQASPLGRRLAEATGAELDRQGRVRVAPDLSVPGHPEILVLGDLAHVEQDGALLPGVAPVAMQEGAYAARLLLDRRSGQPTEPFRYRDKGSLAVIGRNAAVAALAGRHFSGRLAWFLWAGVHIAYLVEFDSKLKVMLQWAWNYVTRQRGARLITPEG